MEREGLIRENARLRARVRELESGGTGDRPCQPYLLRMRGNGTIESYLIGAERVLQGRISYPVSATYERGVTPDWVDAFYLSVAPKSAVGFTWKNLTPWVLHMVFFHNGRKASDERVGSGRTMAPRMGRISRGEAQFKMIACLDGTESWIYGCKGTIVVAASSE